MSTQSFKINFEALAEDLVAKSVACDKLLKEILESEALKDHPELCDKVEKFLKEQP